MNGIDNDTARACGNLLDRIWDKYMGGGKATSRLTAERHEPMRRLSRTYLYHKGNPVPPEVRGWIVARLREGDFYVEIAKPAGVSIATVFKIARKHGLMRGQGRRTRQPSPVVEAAA
jgi:hypothetical protein